jgi:hypothetical protein
MRRAVARGRVFPQSYSTDRRYGRLSLKAIGLFPLLWANADDQGRLCGDPEEVKYTCCPNIDHITKADIPGILKELQDNRLIQVYETTVSAAIQLLDWWDIQRPQWAYPSEFPATEGWRDRLRYHRSPTEVITENWVPPGQFDRGLHYALPSALPSVLANSEKRVSGSGLPEELPGALANTTKGASGGELPKPIRSTPANIGEGVSGSELPDELANALPGTLANDSTDVPSPLITPIPLPPINKYQDKSGERVIPIEDEEGMLPSALGSAPGSTTAIKERETDAPHSRMEADETLCEGDREVISVWCSVKGFKLTPADASALVASLRTEFPEVDLLAESKRWAARKLSEPLKDNSRPSQQIWNWIEMARKFSRQRSLKGEKGQTNRVTGDNPPSVFGQGPWYAGSRR